MSVTNQVRQKYKDREEQVCTSCKGSIVLPPTKSGYSQTTLPIFNDVQWNSGSAEILATVPPKFTTMDEECALMKLGMASTMDDFISWAAWAGKDFSERRNHKVVKYYSAWAGVKNAESGNGGRVSAISHFNWINNLYMKTNQWDMPEWATFVPWPLYMDARNVWGSNTLIAWGPRYVKGVLSCEHIWPLAFYKGSEDQVVYSNANDDFKFGEACVYVESQVFPLYY